MDISAYRAPFWPVLCRFHCMENSGSLGVSVAGAMNLGWVDKRFQFSGGSNACMSSGQAFSLKAESLFSLNISPLNNIQNNR
jgi:hypothetical protein